MAAYYQKNPKQAATIFNGMVNPVIPYAIRGTIWYQGESNRDYNTLKYEQHFSAMIGTWRKLWAQGEFPLLLRPADQLPGTLARQLRPTRDEARGV